MTLVIDAQVTLDGSAQKLDAIFSGYDKCSEIRVTPDASNAHVIVVSGPAGKQLKQVAKPSATDAVQDEFKIGDVSHNTNNIVVAQFAIKGTNTEKANVTLFVA